MRPSQTGLSAPAHPALRRRALCSQEGESSIGDGSGAWQKTARRALGHGTVFRAFRASNAHMSVSESAFAPVHGWSSPTSSWLVVRGRLWKTRSPPSGRREAADELPAHLLGGHFRGPALLAGLPLAWWPNGLAANVTRLLRLGHWRRPSAPELLQQQVPVLYEFGDFLLELPLVFFCGPGYDSSPTWCAQSWRTSSR